MRHAYAAQVCVNPRCLHKPNWIWLGWKYEEEKGDQNDLHGAHSINVRGACEQLPFETG